MNWLDAELVLIALAAMLSPTTLTFSVLALVLGDRPKAEAALGEARRRLRSADGPGQVAKLEQLAHRRRKSRQIEDARSRHAHERRPRKSRSHHEAQPAADRAGPQVEGRWNSGRQPGKG